MEKEYTLPDLYDCTGDNSWVYHALRKIGEYIPRDSILGNKSLDSFGPWNYKINGAEIKISKKKRENPKIVISSENPGKTMKIVLERLILEAPKIEMQTELLNLRWILQKEIQTA